MKHSSVLIGFVLAVFWGSGCQLPPPNGNGNMINPGKAVSQPQMEDPFDPDRPPTAKTLYLMADILTAQGKDADAERIYKRILSKYPDFQPAYNELAMLQMRQRRIPEATQTLQSGLENNPDDPVLLNNMGMCCLIRKDYEKALFYFTSAAGIVPENTRYRSNMATVLALLGRRDEALSLYRQILPEEEAMENIQILYRSAQQDKN